MSRILAVLAGCSLVVGLLTSPPVGAAPGTLSASRTAASQFPDPGAGSYFPVRGNPVRVLDTRSGLGGRLGAVAPRHTVTAPVRRAGTPAAVIKVTVPGNAPAGSLSVYPSGSVWNGHVTMSLVGGSTISQQLTVKLGANGGVTIRNNSATAVHLIVEVLGDYKPGTPTRSGTFAALDSRILDTRATSPLLPGRRITLAMPGRGGIPAGGASAVVLNIAVLSARATGLLSVTTGDGRQATLHMRFLGNRTAPQPMQTQRVVKVNSDGKLTFSQSSTAGVHLVIDLMGYYLPGSDSPDFQVVEGHYVAVSPTPIKAMLGTRSGTQLRLFQQQPLPLYLGVTDELTLAYNIVLSPDQPGQPTLLGLYNPHSPWSRTVTLSSTPARQPTELTINKRVEDTVELVNLSGAQETYLHGYVTGYYWFLTCVYC
ncbi:MAG TPA: hypothetical protein VF557_06765 [Jatrophihabitans sp.]|jgi:hypothetical protein|uniref:hypothetical protein n=1 Tax=Jatrophihabitans sp. TaxID=1932789 RepID=UPI002F122E05